MCSFVVFLETSEPCILFSSEGLIIEGSLIAELVSVFIETSCIGFVQADKHKLKNKKVNVIICFKFDITHSSFSYKSICGICYANPADTQLFTVSMSS